MRRGTQADQDGYFVIRDLPATTWQVIVEEKGPFLDRLLRVQNGWWTESYRLFMLSRDAPYPPREYYASYEDARAALLAFPIFRPHDYQAFSEASVRTRNGMTKSIEIDWDHWRSLRGRVTNLMKGETGVAYSFIEDVPPTELDPLRLDMNSFNDALKKYETRQAEFGQDGYFQIPDAGTGEIRSRTIVVVSSHGRFGITEGTAGQFEITGGTAGTSSIQVALY